MDREISYLPDLVIMYLLLSEDGWAMVTKTKKAQGPAKIKAIIISLHLVWPSVSFTLSLAVNEQPKKDFLFRQNILA